jgi:Helicase HerA, central domain
MATKLERSYIDLRERLVRLNEKIINEYITNVTGVSDDERVAIGSITPVVIQDVVKEIMRHWVKAHDTMINECLYQKLEPTNTFFLLMKMNRGVTFDEFQMVLKTSDYDTIQISEKEYKYFRAYDFFKIHDRIDRKQFIIKNNYDKDNFQDYVRMLEQYKIPIVSFFLAKKIPAYFPFSALLKHSYLTAGSGSGKTELMKLIIYNLQSKTHKHHNASIVVFDPQGDFARECLKFKMNRESNRIIYIDLYIHKELQKYGIIEKNEATFSPIINPFDIDDKSIDAVGKMTIELARAFEELLKDSTITGNMETFLHPCISTLLFRENSSIRDLQRFMQDGNNEDLRQLGRQNPIPDHKNFFVSGGFDIPLYKKTKDALAQKIQQLLNLPNFSRIMVGKSTVDLRKALNSGKVVLINLSKGELTPMTSQAIGKILFAMIQGIGFRRVDTPKEKRKNTFVIVDEFQNFAISYVKNMLEEIRQYKIGFLMAQQYAGQGMDGDFLDSILTNTTLKVIGSNDPNTFRELARSTGISEVELKELPKHNFYIFNRDAKGKHNQKYFQIKAPDALVDTNNTAFYLSNEQYKELLAYLVFKSGQYTKDAININEGVSTENNTETTASQRPQEQEERKTSKERKNTTETSQKNNKETRNTLDQDKTTIGTIPKPKLPL